jgi:DNA invertase Pin-like site-specific DNA recombinase
VVVVYKLDRLARKTTVLLDMVEFFNIYNVSFVSTVENIDTSSAT